MENNKSNPTENKEPNSTPYQSDRNLRRKIETIRFILLSTTLYFLTDTVGCWFVPHGTSIAGLYTILIWILCFITGALQFYFWRKTFHNKWLKWSTLVAYAVLLPILLWIIGFYNYGKATYLGYKLSITIMPLWGFLIAGTFTRVLKWYGSFIKKTFKLSSIKSITFLLCMLIPIVVILLLFIGSYKLSGCLSQRGEDIQLLMTKGEINHNKDHREPVRQYDRLFNDLNAVQLEAAHKNGLKAPITASQATTDSHLTHIKPNTYYNVAKLTHSQPYLVPKAAKLLEDMGRAFQDSLYNRGYNRNHRFTVSSVLRTEDDIRKLRQVNVNAANNSCHRYATTFDIAYYKYTTPSSGKIASAEKMRQVLYQVAYDMQRQGRCYVKYEKQQSCLHITVR